MIPKFRAWDKIRNRISEVERIYIDTKGVRLRDENGEYWRRFDDVILMQSTGLVDKNGKEIFEGDVVKCYTVTEESECEYVGVVCFKDFSFVIVDKKDTYDPLWNYKGGFVSQETELEVIGNIYENPELMEG
ncbi:hypothetical protein HO914_01640 [Streptococcus suis]|nr:hypothetical protein [Streptococcus suis]